MFLSGLLLEMKKPMHRWGCMGHGLMMLRPIQRRFAKVHRVVIRILMHRFLSLFITVLAVFSRVLYGGDQNSIGNGQDPVDVKIISSNPATSDGFRIGDVQAIYGDGSKQLLTSAGNCSMARILGGTVGWTVMEHETHTSGANAKRSNHTLILWTRGKPFSQITSKKDLITAWSFYNFDKLVLITRGIHGPAEAELHNIANGQLIESVKVRGQNLPVWAQLISKDSILQGFEQ
jgi:hypothetical protein